MRKKSHPKHFLFHTLEQVLGIFGILVVAVSVAVFTPNMSGPSALRDTLPPSEPTLYIASVLPSGVSLYWEGATDNVGVVGYQLFKNGKLLVSQTMPTFTDSSDLLPGSRIAYHIASVDSSGNISAPSETVLATVPASVEGNSTGQKEIAFSVTPAPITDCTTGKPMHEVFFAVSDPVGGDFLLEGGASTMTIPWGRQVLSNGSYQWKGIPRAGYSITGDASDEFTLFGECIFGSTGSPVLPSKEDLMSTTTMMLTPIAGNQPRPSLRFFFDSVPVSDMERRFSGEHIELRVGTSKAKKVNYYAMKEGASVPTSIGVGVYDDLLSLKDTEVWVMTWQTRNIPSGAYRVFARVLLLSGEVVESLPMSVIIDHEESEAVLDTVPEKQEVPEVKTLPQRVAPVKKSSVVSEPALCTDVTSCKAYCLKGASESGRCVTFAREEIGTSSLAFVSLADGISYDRISNLLDDVTRRPKDLPEYILDAKDFVAFCRDLSHEEICARILKRSNLASEEELESRSANMKTEQETIDRIFWDRTGARIFLDIDGDQVSDYDEVNIYGTNPNESDSDGDGFQDGAEIANHTNPLGDQKGTDIELVRGVATDTLEQKASEEVVMEDPRLFEGLFSPSLSVDDLTLTRDEEGVEKDVLAFSGIAPRYSYVTLFVFSSPIAVSVRANASGTWSFMLNKDLAPGTHEAILSVSDSRGKVLTRSASLTFVKDASGIIVDADKALPSDPTPSSARIFALVAILLAGLGILFSTIGILIHWKQPGRKHAHTA